MQVSEDDNLPKKICDGCSNKLDTLYTFRNTSVDSEKQLKSWLSEAGLSEDDFSATASCGGIGKSEILIVKQENFEATDVRLENEQGELATDPFEAQPKMPYQDFAFVEASSSCVSDEPPRKRPKRASTRVKAPIVEPEEEDEDDDGLDASMPVTKVVFFWFIFMFSITFV